MLGEKALAFLRQIIPGLKPTEKDQEESKNKKKKEEMKERKRQKKS